MSINFKPFDTLVLGTLMDEKSINPLGKSDFLEKGERSFYISTHGLYFLRNKDVVSFLKKLPDDKQSKYIKELGLEDFNYGGIDEMFNNLDSINNFEYCAFLLKKHSPLLEDYEKSIGWGNLEEAKNFLKDVKFHLDDSNSSSQTVLFNKEALKSFFKIAEKKFPAVYAHYKYNKTIDGMSVFYGRSVSDSILEIKDEQGNVLKVKPITHQVMKDMPKLNIPLFFANPGTDKNPSYVIEDALEIDIDVIMGLGKDNIAHNTNNTMPERFNIYKNLFSSGHLLKNGDLVQDLVKNKLIVKCLGPKFYISSGRLLRNDDIKDSVLKEFAKIYKKKFFQKEGFYKIKETTSMDKENASLGNKWNMFLNSANKMREQFSLILHKVTFGDDESWEDKKREVYRKSFYNVMQEYLDEQMDGKVYENLKNKGILKNYLHLLSRNLLAGEDKYEEIEGLKKDFKEIRFYTLKDLLMDEGAGEKLLKEIIYNKDFPEIHHKAYEVVFSDFIFNHMAKFDFEQMNSGILEKAMHTVFIDKGNNVVYEDYKFALFNEGLKRGFFDDTESTLSIAAKNVMLKTYSSNDFVLLYQGCDNDLKKKVNKIFKPNFIKPETKVEKDIKTMCIYLGDFKPIFRYKDLEAFLNEREANVKTVFSYVKMFNMGVMAVADELLKRDDSSFNYLEMSSVFQKNVIDSVKNKGMDCLYKFKTPLFLNLGSVDEERAQEFKENIIPLIEQVWDSVLSLDKEGLKRETKNIVPTYRSLANAFVLNKELNKNMEKISLDSSNTSSTEDGSSEDEYTFKI